MKCSVAAILSVLNATELPPRGTVIVVPAYVADRYSDHEQRTVRNCAFRVGGIVLKKAER